MTKAEIIEQMDFLNEHLRIEFGINLTTLPLSVYDDIALIIKDLPVEKISYAIHDIMNFQFYSGLINSWMISKDGENFEEHNDMLKKTISIYGWRNSYE